MNILQTMRSKMGNTLPTPSKKFSMKKVAIVEDQTAIREMLSSIISSETQHETIDCTGNGQEAVSMCLEHSPDIVITEISLPGLNGLELSRRLLRIQPNLRIIIFTSGLTPVLVLELTKLGIHGIVEKTSSLGELVKCLAVVSKGGTHYGPSVQQMIEDAKNKPNTTIAKLNSLTTRERELLQMAADNLSIQQMAERLQISSKTVENHRCNLMRKLDVPDKLSLLRFSLQHGVVCRGNTVL